MISRGSCYCTPGHCEEESEIVSLFVLGSRSCIPFITLKTNEFKYRELSLGRERTFSFIFPCDMLFFYSRRTYTGSFCNDLPLFIQLLFAISNRNLLTYSHPTFPDTYLPSPLCLDRIFLPATHYNSPNSLESNLCENPRSATLSSSSNQAFQSFSPDKLLFS